MKTLFTFILIGLFVFNSCVKQNSKTDSVQPKNNEKATFYVKKAKLFKKNFVHDSAFYYYHQALNQYSIYGDKESMVDMYFQLAVISSHLSDYVESNQFAVRMLELSQNNEQIVKAYTLLGVNFKNLMLYPQAQSSYDSLRKYIEASQLNSKIAYYNNVGLLYTKMQHYDVAVTYFDSILTLPNITRQDVKYARALDNKGFALFQLNQVLEAKKLLQNALDIRLKANDEPGLTMSYLHWSEFYQNQNTNLSEKFAKQALTLTQKIDDKRDRLDAYQQLIAINPTQQVLYFEEYLKIQNEVLNEERQFKNFAAYIKFDSEKKEKKITAQQKVIKNREKSLLIGTGLVLLLSYFIYTINKNRKKIALKNLEIEQFNQQLTQQKELLQKLNLQLEHQKVELQNNNQKLTEQNQLIEKLQREIHHRVFNDLKKVQILIGFENKQRPNDFLTDIDTKITAMLLVHSQLLAKNAFEKVNMQTYLYDLTFYRYNLYAGDKTNIKFKVVSNASLDSHKAVIAGLIVSEWLTNTFKYAFTDVSVGTITIALQYISETESYQLDYQDNGKGLTDTEQSEIKTSQGMDLVSGFVLQLSGQLTTIDTQKGVHYQLQFKI